MGENIWNFLKEFSWPFGLCAGLFALASRFIPLTGSMNLLLAIAINVVLIALIICLSGYIIRRGPPKDHPTIKIEQARDAGRILIVQKTSALGVNMGAMIYMKDGAYERLVAAGSVTHVQTDGLIQIGIQYLDGAEEDLITRISQNIKETISSLIVRPGVKMEDITFPGASA